MTKNNYKAIADFCKENNIKFARYPHLSMWTGV